MEAAGNVIMEAVRSHSARFAIVLCVLTPLILLLLRKALASGNKLPPGPRGWPMIGHLGLLAGKDPHRCLYALSKIHGPLMTLRLGSVPVLVASTPDMARQLLLTHDKTFSARPPTTAGSLIFGSAGVVNAPPGPRAKLLRQIFVTDLLCKKRVETFSPLRTEEVRALMRSLATTHGPVSVRRELYGAANNIISRMALGKRLHELASYSQADPSNDIVTLLLEMSDLMGVFNVGDYVPSLAWMDLQGYSRRSKVVGHKINQVFQEVIDGRRSMRSSANDGAVHNHDFLDVLLSANTSANNDVEIRDEDIKTVLLETFAGGINTTPITIEWIFAELLANPAKMKLAHEELQRVVGTSRLVEESDIPNLPYLQAVLKENFRLHPVGPLLFPHMSTKPCEILGYMIPANTIAYVNVWAIGRDPNIWDKPLEFCPERFLDNNVGVQGQHFELLPFGSGRRQCPGWILSIATIQLVLASLLHGFDWTIVGELDTSEKFSIAMGLANPLVAKTTPILPTYLY